ncbi:MAG TPA: universal stress protein [Polyangiaceae bacterium]|nr:universal stress protein [Polyangiaceae bacterium]
MSIIKNILVASDLSELSHSALGVAVDLSRTHNAGLTILHVHETAPFELPQGYVQNLPSQLGRDYDSINQRLSQLERKARSLGVLRVETRILHGAVVDEIVRFSEGFDCLVTGTHGRGGLERWVMGSVAQKVLDRATCPVVVVRPARNRKPTQ